MSTDKPRKRYMDMSPRELHNYLTRKNRFPPDFVSRIVDRLALRKEERRVSRIKRTQFLQEWRDLWNPLQKEISNSRMLRDRPQTKAESNTNYNARVRAYGEYCNALTKVLLKLREARKAVGEEDQITPSMLAAQTNKTLAQLGKAYRVQNSGRHWSDWVPEKDRRLIQDLFDFAPSIKKKPFKRVSTTEVWTKQYGTLKGTIAIEIERQQALVNILEPRNSGEGRNSFDDAPHKKAKARIVKAKKALAKLEAWPALAPLPRTWHGLINYVHPPEEAARMAAVGEEY